MNSHALAGQVAVITGASSGIGLAVACEFKACGMHLVLTARNPERLAAIADELGAVSLAEDIARCVRFVLSQPAQVRIPKLMVRPGEHQI